MRRALAVIAIVAITGWLGYLYARSPKSGEPARPIRPSEQRPVPTHKASDGALVGKGCDDLAHTIRAAISRGGPIPDGTRLVGVTLDGSECVVELSSEFAGVNQQGTTGEAEAQNSLRAALAGFPRVRTLQVRVDGAVFEGSHSGEWVGIPVGGDAPPEDDGT
ncbi:MAG: GerMN domain-containing protein [Armatimonadetes bacterium]|nr:GerMN domain-containing protein [Armatimonadota bacterium]